MLLQLFFFHFFKWGYDFLNLIEASRNWPSLYTTYRIISNYPSFFRIWGSGTGVVKRKFTFCSREKNSDYHTLFVWNIKNIAEFRHFQNSDFGRDFCGGHYTVGEKMTIKSIKSRIFQLPRAFHYSGSVSFPGHSLNSALIKDIHNLYVFDQWLRSYFYAGMNSQQLIFLSFYLIIIFFYNLMFSIIISLSLFLRVLEYSVLQRFPTWGTWI